MRYSDRSTRSVQRRLPRPEDNEYAFIPLLHEMIDELWRPGMAVRLVGVAVTGFDERDHVQESLFDSSDFVTDDKDRHPHAEAKPPSIDAGTRPQAFARTDIVKDRFGESAVFYGRELQVKDNTTGTAAKNPADY